MIEIPLVGILSTYHISFCFISIYLLTLRFIYETFIFAEFLYIFFLCSKIFFPHPNSLILPHLYSLCVYERVIFTNYSDAQHSNDDDNGDDGHSFSSTSKTSARCLVYTYCIIKHSKRIHNRKCETFTFLVW